MKPLNLRRGTQIATAVASMLAISGCASDMGSSSKDAQLSANPLTCIGGNSCEGMSQCAGGPGGSSCEGLNSCQGMGWDYANSKEDCDKAGGYVVGMGDVQCSGANLCAGMSQCAGGASGNMCMGMNDCAGMGWDYTETKADCDKAGGTVIES